MARPKQVWRTVKTAKANGIQAFLGTVSNAQPLPDADRARLELSLTISLKLILKGKGGPKEYNDLLEAVTLTRVQAEQIKDEAASYACYEAANAGMWAMNSIRERYMKTGKIGLAGEELQAINGALDVYFQFIAKLTRGELVEALRLAKIELA